MTERRPLVLIDGIPRELPSGDDTPVGSHTHPSTAISDSTTAGRALLTAADAAAQRTSLGLGTAATAAVTTSATDTTAGRLLKVGDFGVGGAAIDAGYEANLNDLSVFKLGSTVSVYGYNTGAWNDPPLGGGVILVWFNVITIGNPNRVTQIASAPFAHTRRMFVRHRNDEAWSRWFELYTQASILGTVSQSGGTPTGAIIERGSNANGEYVRFADGTQICTQVFVVPVTLAAGASAQIIDSWTLPASIAAGGELTIAVVGSNPQYFTAAWTGGDYTSLAGLMLRNNSTVAITSTPLNIRVSLTGRWF